MPKSGPGQSSKRAFKCPACCKGYVNHESLLFHIRIGCRAQSRSSRVEADVDAGGDEIEEGGEGDDAGDGDGGDEDAEDGAGGGGEDDAGDGG